VPNSRKPGSRRTHWQLCLSVLLIGLVLYNPFLALANSADGLAYQTLARHRATVGASEMQHFTPVQGENARPEAALEEIPTEVVSEHNQYPAQNFHEETLPQRPELIDGFWFRPPPALHVS